MVENVLSYLNAHPPVAWVALGVAGLALEASVTTPFLFLWFAAIGTGLILLFAPGASLPAQLLVFGATAVASYVLYGRWKRTQKEPFTTGDIKQQLAKAPLGTVTADGWVRLDESFLGAREWKAANGEGLAEGQRVRVLDVMGNELKVEAINNKEVQ